MNWDINWFDHGGLTPEFLSSLQPWQKVNHFLGMYNISRKNTLGIHLKRFQKEFSKEYDFFPNTWLYPTDFYEINEYYNSKVSIRKQKIKDGKMTEAQAQQSPVLLFICKPEASCQGKGIFLVRRIEDLRLQLNMQLQAQQKQFHEYLQAQQSYDNALYFSSKPNLAYQNKEGNDTLNNSSQSTTCEAPTIVEKYNTYVVQKYLKNPALIDGHKFDFRIYVLITTVVEPLTIYLYQDGLVRLASEKYTSSRNIQDLFVHLTNYSLNKKNNNFDGDKHKLKLSDCLRNGFTCQSEKGVFRKTKEQIWSEIEDIVIKTVLTIQPQLQHYYRSCQPKEPDICYELLGFDIILDNKVKPWLLEVNHLPSFNSDTQVDEQVKYELIRDIFSILALSVENRKKLHKEMKNDYKLALQTGCFKRLSAKEHCEKVRFDPTCVEKLQPNNNFRLIYPKSTQDDQYEKFQKKANEIWQMTTGTLRLQQPNPPPQKKKKTMKSRHRKQSQILQQQQTEQQSTSHTDPTRKASDLEQMQANTESNQEQINLLTDNRLQSLSQLTKDPQQQQFFEKRQGSTLKQQTTFSSQPPNSQQSQQVRTTTKQYLTQRQQQKIFTRASNNPVRTSMVVKNSNNSQLITSDATNANTNNKRQLITIQKQTYPPPSSSSQQNQQIEQQDSSSLQILESNCIVDNNEDIEPNIGTPLDQSDQIRVLSEQLNLDLLSKLHLNHGQLKYKDYCRALMDDFSSQYYKTNGLQQEQVQGARSISQGVTASNSNKNTLNISSQQYKSSLNNVAVQSQHANGQFHWSSNSNWFIQKLKNVINDSQQVKAPGGTIINNKICHNRHGIIVGGLISPGAQRKSKSNPFQNSIIKSKEDLAMCTVAMNQRVMFRGEQQTKGFVDMAPINMSAGVIDFKVQYKRQNRRFQSNTNTSSQHNNIQSKSQQPHSQQNQPPPQIKLQWVNDSQEFVNNLGSEDIQSLGLITNFRSKREQKNSRILAIENYKYERNLEKLKEFEKRLLSNAVLPQQHTNI